MTTLELLAGQEEATLAVPGKSRKLDRMETAVVRARLAFAGKHIPVLYDKDQYITLTDKQAVLVERYIYG